VFVERTTPVCRVVDSSRDFLCRCTGGFDSLTRVGFPRLGSATMPIATRTCLRPFAALVASCALAGCGGGGSSSSSNGQEKQTESDFAVLNADDSAVVGLAPKRPQVYWFSRRKEVSQVCLAWPSDLVPSMGNVNSEPAFSGSEVH